MKKNDFINAFLVVLVTIGVCVTSCSSGGDRNTKAMKITASEEGNIYKTDVDFFKKHDIETIELSDNKNARVLIVPAYQGRVMTSSARGEDGYSYGWINYDLIAAEEINPQFNPYGGEERFWLGPEGGPFSIYFKEGVVQEFKNWKVPDVIDTKPFRVVEKSDFHALFTKSALITNASGTQFNLDILRKVSLLSIDTLNTLFGVTFDSSLDVVAYQSENTITNRGDHAWSKEKGLLSVWMLSMFNPLPTTTVFIPFKADSNQKIVNDDYFGKVPSDRLDIRENTIYFKIDGKYRSKIGVPPERASSICGSYDSGKNLLTIVWSTPPGDDDLYVNSKWGDQEDPYAGDVINSYNDGPVDDGSIMGPFYEIETSSPAADLTPGESLTHVQRIVHVQGDKKKMESLVWNLFHLNLEEIENVF